MEGDGEKGRQAASKRWEKRLPEKTDEQKHAVTNMPCQCVASGDLKITTLQEQQQGLFFPKAPETAESNKGLI